MQGHLSKDVITARVVERLWSYIAVSSADECWEWKGSLYRNGYGRLTVWDPTVRKFRQIGPHRLMFIVENGTDIPAGMHVMHSCDNPPCCNPAHLDLGTPLDNMRDRDAKGRNGGWKTRNRPRGSSSRKGKTGYIGVWVETDTRAKRYRAQLNKTYIGHFYTPEEAARAVDEERVRVYGPNVTLNFPHERSAP